MGVRGHIAVLASTVLFAASCQSQPLRRLSTSSPLQAEAPVEKTFIAHPMRPKLQKLVDDLAENGRGVQERWVGRAGMPSATWAMASAVNLEALDSEVVALLEHPSPVVRGYMVTTIARKRPWLSYALPALSDDEAAVQRADGCFGYRTTIGELTVAELCKATDASARPALRVLVNSNAAARECLR